LASFYFCDEIIIVNGGYDLKHLDETEYNIPLLQVSRDISDIDFAGKVIEIKDFTLDDLEHKAILSTQKANLSEPWFDMRGVCGTLANETAVKRGATTILKFDSDQVAYRNARNVRYDQRSVMFKQTEFAVDIYHLGVPQPDSPWDDSVFTYPAVKGDYYGGGMGPHIHGARIKVSDYRCAHLRHANPDHLRPSQQFSHFYGRLVFRYFTNDFGVFSEKLYEKAFSGAKSMFAVKKVRSTVPPPEVCLSKPRIYAEEMELWSK